MKAKQQQILREVGPILARLKSEAGFWLGERLEKRILEDVGEI